MGHEGDAREIAIAKQQALFERGDLSRRHKAWLWLMGGLIGYGYKPWRVLIYMTLAVVIGTGFFMRGYHIDAMRPSKERVYIHRCYAEITETCPNVWIKVDTGWPQEGKSVNLPADYPRFNSLIYALDTFLPIVDLHQETYWLPRSPGLRVYLWLHIALGWILTTIGVVGLTGIIKKD